MMCTNLYINNCYKSIQISSTIFQQSHLYFLTLTSKYYMGQCVCVRPKPQKKYQFDKEPLDTQTLSTHSLAKLSFNVTLSNIVLHKCQYNKISAKLSIGSIQQFQFQPKIPSEKQQIKWKSELKTKFQMTQYQLRKSYLYIDLFDQSKNVIGKIKINLYIISIGPYHQNFKIQYLNGSVGRISLDFKISQIIDIKIDSLMVEIDLIKKHPGQKFCFSIKPIMEETENQLNISIPSYTVMEVLGNYQEEQAQIQKSPQLKLKRSNSIKFKLPQKIIKTGSNLIWKKQKCLQLPSVELKILASDLHHSYFQVLIWKINDQRQKQDEEQKLQYHAECFISFQKILSKQPIEVVQSEKSYEQRVIQVNQRLWRNGKDYGSAAFNLKIKNEKYVKQMPICVRTERGIQKLAPIFHSQDSKNVKSCQQIQKLITINNEIQNIMAHLNEMEAENGYTKQSRRFKRLIQQNLEEMIPILQTSAKDKIIIYQYANKKELLKAQQTFLQIANRISKYLEEENQSISQIYWLILIYIIKRGQFTLAFIGFDENQRNCIERADISGVLNRKIKVGEKYRQFMTSILKLAVKSLSSQGLQLQRKFAQISCAYAYFRISSFRNEVLKCITKENEQVQITQWRGIQFSLEQDQDYAAIRQNVNAFALLFDWDHCFHKCLGAQEAQSNELNTILQQNTSNNWRVRFANRNIAFFQFIKYWVEYIESIVYKAKGIQWKYCPGYNRILKAFLLQMKNRKILQYPDSLIEAALKLMINQKLLNPFVMIILSKANIYEPLTVKKSLSFISDMLSTISIAGKTIPALFNYSILFKGLKIIFQSDVSFAISAALVLLYNHFDLFHLDFQRAISMYLLGKVFFKIFLHWDQNVRLYFYYLLIFRILHEFRFYFGEEYNFQVDRKLKHLYNSEVKSRYEKLMNILQNALNVRIQQQKQMMKIVYDKDLHKKMKKKFQKKRKKDHFQQEQSFKGSYSQEERKKSHKKYFQNSQFTKQTSIDKYSLSKLDQNRIQKTQSQRLSTQLLEQIQQNYKTISIINIEDDPKSEHPNQKSSSFHFKNKVQDTTQMKDQKINKKAIRQNLQQSYPNMKFYGGGGQECKTQFIQVQIKELKQEQIHYLKVSMLAYRSLKQSHLSNMASKKIQRPKLKMLVSMIDQQQIRPDKIDDW